MEFWIIGAAFALLLFVIWVMWEAIEEQRQKLERHEASIVQLFHEIDKQCSTSLSNGE